MSDRRERVIGKRAWTLSDGIALPRTMRVKCHVDLSIGVRRDDVGPPKVSSDVLRTPSADGNSGIGSAGEKMEKNPAALDMRGAQRVIIPTLRGVDRFQAQPK